MKRLHKVALLTITVIVVTLAIFLFWPERRGEEGGIEEEVNSIIGGFDGNDPRSFYSVSEIADLGVEAVPYLEEMVESGSLYERWATIVSLSNILRKDQNLREEVLPFLIKGMEDEHSTLKLLSAAQVTSFGEKKGVPVLISCLSSEEVTAFSDPPHPVAEQADLYLRHFTGQDFDFSYGDPKESKEEAVLMWQHWWEENQDLISWNKEEGVFEVNE